MNYALKVSVILYMYTYIHSHTMCLKCPLENYDGYPHRQNWTTNPITKSQPALEFMSLNFYLHTEGHAFWLFSWKLLVQLWKERPKIYNNTTYGLQQSILWNVPWQKFFRLTDLERITSNSFLHTIRELFQLMICFNMLSSLIHRFSRILRNW